MVYINSYGSRNKRAGRKPMSLEKNRTGRLAMRTYPDIAQKARRVGTEAVESAIRGIKEPF